MTLTPDQWAKLQAESEAEYRPLIHRDELRSQFENQPPQVVQSVTMPPDWELLRELDWSHRRKGNQRIVDEEWSVVVGDIRGLEDLVLECVDAGISLANYL